MDPHTDVSPGLCAMAAHRRAVWTTTDDGELCHCVGDNDKKDCGLVLWMATSLSGVKGLVSFNNGQKVICQHPTP